MAHRKESVRPKAEIDYQAKKNLQDKLTSTYKKSKVREKKSREDLKATIPSREHGTFGGYKPTEESKRLNKEINKERKFQKWNDKYEAKLEKIKDKPITKHGTGSIEKKKLLKSLKKTYDRGIDLTVEGKRFIDKDVSFEDWVHKKGKGDLFFNEFQRGPDRREFLTHNLFNPVKEEPYKMKFPGRESIDFSAVPYEAGGRVGLKKGKTPYRLSRRGFLQWLAGITGAGIAAGTGLIKLGGKTATKVAPKVTEEVIKRGVDGMPTYIDNLIKVVQSKGVKNIVESNIGKYSDTVHSYKGVDVTQDATGNIKIKSDKSGVSTDPYTGKMHEGISQENHIQIERGEWIEPTKTKKGIKTKDEYREGSVYPDRDGKSYRSI